MSLTHALGTRHQRSELLSARRQLVTIPSEADRIGHPATAAYVCVCMYI